MKNKIHLLLLLLMIICCYNQIEAQTTKHFYSVSTDELTPNEWQAKWIWLPGISNTDKNHYMLARKSFFLNKKPEETRLYITADSHYKLWINGKFITRGPARCSPHHQSYDVLDISPNLADGENIIAVMVHYHGMMKSYYLDPYPGLLVQLEWEENNQMQYIVSDKSWKVKRDFAWDNRTELVNRVNANNYTSSYNFNHATPEWYSPGFNDSNWINAVYQTGPNIWPPKPDDYEPFAIQRPWFDLVQRDIPPLKETNIDAFRIVKIMEAPQYSKYKTWGDKKIYDALHHSNQDVFKEIKHSKVSNAKDFLKGHKPLIIENSYPSEKYTKQPVYHTVVVFDFEELVSGYPYLEVQGGKGNIIDINYVPYLIDDVFIPGIMLDNWADRITLSGKEEKWEATELRPFRYMSVTIRGRHPVSIKKFGLRREQYPFKKRGEIKVDSEPFIEKLWDAGEKTIKTITTDAFTDNYHENRQYVQTSFYASRGNYSSFFDPYLQRRYLIQHAQDQLPNGMIPMWAPWIIYEGNQQIPGIFEANHFWLMGLRDYFLHTGDTITTKELLTSAERCAQAINKLQVKNNLIHKPPYPYWIDWAKLAKGDQNFIINSLQVMAFKQYAELLGWLNKTKMADKWNKEAELMIKSLKKFWNEDTGLFVDNINKNIPDENFSEHANALAIAAGIADEKQTELIIKKIIDNKNTSMMEEATLFNYWVAEALCSKGYISETVDMLHRKYNHMVEDELGTLWENPNLFAENVGERSSSAKDIFSERSWSTAQAENAFPPNILSRYVLGIHPTSPGMTEVKFSSFISPYQEFSGIIPTPKGDIFIKAHGNNKYNIELPDNIYLWIMKDELQKENIQKIIVNNVTYIVDEMGERIYPTKKSLTIFIEK